LAQISGRPSNLPKNEDCSQNRRSLKKWNTALTQSFSGLIAFSNAYNWHTEHGEVYLLVIFWLKEKLKEKKWIDFVGFQ
jgi:hypothetical protein